MVAAGQESEQTREKRQCSRIAAHNRLRLQASFHLFNLVIDLLKCFTQVALRLLKFSINLSRFP